MPLDHVPTAATATAATAAPTPPAAVAAARAIAPAALLDRLVAGEATTILDLRATLDAPIAAAAATVLHHPGPLDAPAAAQLADALPPQSVVVCARGISAVAAAERLRAAGAADPRVLTGGMRAWLGVLQALPVPLPLDGIEVVQVRRPGRGCLSYVVLAGGAAIVVDPAPDAVFYRDLAAARGARVVGVLDTHLHADHLSGAAALAELTGAARLLPRASLERGVAAGAAAVALDDGDELTLGDHVLRVVALPGHTSDMTGLLIGATALLGGDSLFADGIARPDLQRGDPAGARAMARRLHATLHERVLELDDELVLLPGHAAPGVATDALAPTLAAVRAAVPELAIADPAAFAEELLRAMPPRPANYEAVIAANAGARPADPELEQGGNACATR